MRTVLLDKLLTTIHTELPQSDPPFRMRLFTAFLDGNFVVDNFATLGAAANGWVFAAVIHIRASFALHLVHCAFQEKLTQSGNGYVFCQVYMISNAAR